MHKFIIILIASMLIMPAAAVLAHGEEGPKDHRPTQIGGDALLFPDTLEKLSREEVSRMVAPTLEQEDSRASVKFVILALLIFVVGLLFFPRTVSLQKKDEPAAVGDQISQPPSV